ncbi:MAG: Gfo/Idh/MocA family protein [Thermodesulfobacteriota bacterium]
MTKKIKVAVVGVGRLGGFHAEKYAGIESCELVGVSDVDAARAAEVAGKLGVKVYPDYRGLLPLVDAVSIATPTESHLELGRAFLEQGVHVLVEKPIAMDSAEADILVETARSSGAVLQVGHLERFNPAVVALEGRLQTPLFIESYRLSPFPERSTDIDVILDLMIHDIDIIMNLVGEEEPVDIKAMGVPVITRHVDIANARLRFAGGCVANVTANRVSKERTRNIRLFAHDSIIDIDYAAQHISITRSVRSGNGGNAALIDEEIEIQKKDSLLEEIKSFVESCRLGTGPLVSGEAGRRALIVAEGIQESVKKSMARFRV